MKFALISDLHEEFLWSSEEDNLHLNINKHVKDNNVDVLIDAGDSRFPEYYGPDSSSTVRVQGNHYFYGKSIDFHDIGSVHYVKGVKIVATPLWTNLNNLDPTTVNNVVRGMNDFNLIADVTPQKIYDIHKKCVDFILKNDDADIIVTHHLPSFKSVHADYTGSSINHGFYSDLDWLVKLVSPKFWLHGHTHKFIDYSIGNTRVLCNPHGYPEERKGLDPYKPLIMGL